MWFVQALLFCKLTFVFLFLLLLIAFLCLLLDIAGGDTTTFDTCFHPEALFRAKQIDSFRHLVATSSIEAVEQNMVKILRQKITAQRSESILHRARLL